jgi:hypothetical protein
MGMDRELALDKFDGYYSGVELQHMNARFTAAMAAAIRAHREHPPQVGIDHTPGTKNPMYYVVRGSEGSIRQSQGLLW